MGFLHNPALQVRIWSSIIASGEDSTRLSKRAVLSSRSRSELTSALRISPLKSPILMGGAAIALLVHIVAMHIPLGQRLLDTEPVSAVNWVYLLLAALSILVVMELHKLYWNRYAAKR